MPTPGEVRNEGQETSNGREVVFQTADGAPVYKGPVSSHTYPVYEAWCTHCGWVKAKGLIAVIMKRVCCTKCNRDFTPKEDGL